MFRASLVVAALVAGGLIVVKPVVAEDVKCAGQISRIEGVNVTVLEMAKEQRMKLEPATKITSGGKPVMVGDLKVGQKVQCVLDKQGEEFVCKAMEIMRDTP
jgi:hypothetical protein